MKTFRFVTVLLVALSMSMAFCHLLEMSAKMGYDGALWLTLLQTLYGAFGTVGGFIEVGAVVAAIVAAYLVRSRRPAFSWTLAAALCMVLAHAAWWLFVRPVNEALVPLAPEALPADWVTLRNQWEYTHAARALLQILALAFLVISLLAETPAEASRDRAVDAGGRAVDTAADGRLASG